MEVTRVKNKLRLLTLGLIARMSLVCYRKRDHTRVNSADPTFLILSSVNACCPMLFPAWSISDKFNFQFFVVLILVTTKFTPKELTQIKSYTVNVNIFENFWLRDLVRVKICTNWTGRIKKMKQSRNKCVCRRVRIKRISIKWMWESERD
jgi:hypothetical protein